FCQALSPTAVISALSAPIAIFVPTAGADASGPSSTTWRTDTYASSGGEPSANRIRTPPTARSATSGPIAVIRVFRCIDIEAVLSFYGIRCLAKSIGKHRYCTCLGDCPPPPLLRRAESSKHREADQPCDQNRKRAHDLTADQNRWHADFDGLRLGFSERQADRHEVATDLRVIGKQGGQGHRRGNGAVCNLRADDRHTHHLRDNRTRSQNWRQERQPANCG